MREERIAKGEQKKRFEGRRKYEKVQERMTNPSKDRNASGQNQRQKGVRETQNNPKTSKRDTKLNHSLYERELVANTGAIATEGIAVQERERVGI